MLKLCYAVWSGFLPTPRRTFLRPKNYVKIVGVFTGVDSTGAAETFVQVGLLTKVVGREYSFARVLFVYIQTIKR